MVKRLLAERQGLPKKPGLGEAVQLAGLEFTGTHHRGIDDARNIARLLPYVFGEARISASGHMNGSVNSPKQAPKFCSRTDRFGAAPGNSTSNKRQSRGEV